MELGINPSAYFILDLPKVRFTQILLDYMFKNGGWMFIQVYFYRTPWYKGFRKRAKVVFVRDIGIHKEDEMGAGLDPSDI